VIARCVIVLALVAGCSKKQEPQQDPTRPASIPQAELERGRDACKAYVDKVCKCAETVAAVVEQCKLAKALPEVIELALGVSSSTDSTAKDSLHAAAGIRNTIAACIEKTAQLPAQGCP
jgi:hypothetical protein